MTENEFARLPGDYQQQLDKKQRTMTIEEEEHYTARWYAAIDRIREALYGKQ